MHKTYIIVCVWFCFALTAMATENFIVLAHGNDELIKVQQEKYREITKQNLNIDAESKSTDNLIRILKASMQQNKIITFRNLESKSTDNLLRIIKIV